MGSPGKFLLQCVMIVFFQNGCPFPLDSCPSENEASFSLDARGLLEDAERHGLAPGWSICLTVRDRQIAAWRLEKTAPEGQSGRRPGRQPFSSSRRRPEGSRRSVCSPVRLLQSNRAEPSLTIAQSFISSTRKKSCWTCPELYPHLNVPLI